MVLYGPFLGRAHIGYFDENALLYIYFYENE